MSKQPLHWKNLILLLQMVESGFQQEGQDVFIPVHGVDSLFVTTLNF